MADLLVGQYTPIILLKYQACDAEDIPLTYGLPFVCALLGGFPFLAEVGLFFLLIIQFFMDNRPLSYGRYRGGYPPKEGGQGGGK